ncbi:terminase large subunit domain-containing protein [Bacillus alkalicola]|uniref:DNA packaging protein n=2 Tax=Bacillaceae TaxID=186817 RepID=A0ABS6JPU2_9BACI|nr:terminase family protein [Bacillus alkalicola]MBU9720545.1 DNA packaging protein [Bacillus alkalicola]
MAQKLSKKQKLQMIMDDFRLFSKNFIYIVDNENEKVKLDLNKAQVELDELMNKNKFVIVSKARQGGISTFTLAKALWRAVRNENENILIVSYKLDSSKALFEKLKQMNEWLPRTEYPSLFPKVRRENRDELFFDNGSRITCSVAGNKSIGRGSTYSYIHLSEYAFFSRQEMQLLSAEQSLMKGQNSQLTIETTSNGTGNHYHKVFMSAWKGHSKYKAMFIPFYHDLYRKQFKTEHDEAEKWFKETNKGSRLQAKDLTSEEKALHENGANLRFLMWRQYKLMDMELQEFQQEYPSNPMESFISTGQSVFDQAKVLERINHLLEPLHYKDMEDELPQQLRRYVNKGLSIFHLPKTKMKYYGGIDVSSGSGGDYSTISFYDSDGQQVASFYHNKTPVYKFAELVDLLGRWFNYAFLVVESNSYGLPLLERLRNDYQYMNLYKQRTFDQRGRKKMQLGFATTTTTKAILISDYKELFETGLINIECKETLSQMQIFVENNGKTGNKRGTNNYDDLVIANALAIQGMKANRWYVDI